MGVSIFYATFNGLVQGAIVVVLAAAIMRCFRRLNAVTECTVWSVVFLIAAALPLVDLQHPTTVARGGEPSVSATFGRPALPARVVTSIVDGPSPDRHPRLATARTKARHLVRSAVRPLLVLWVLVASLLLARLGIGYLRLSRIKSAARPLDFGDLRVRGRCIPIASSPDIDSACAAGFFRPMILLADADVEMLEYDDLTRIVRHELAHLRRGDHWINLVQRCTLAVLFFHPALRYASRRIDDLREIACDDEVLAGRSAAEPQAYARTLAAVLERIVRSRRSVRAPAFGANRSQVIRRVERVLDERGDRSTRVRRSGLLFIGAVVVVAAIVSPFQVPRGNAIDVHGSLNVASASTSGGALIDTLVRDGYGTPSPDDLIALTNQGVSAEDVFSARSRAEARPSVDALIELTRNGVGRSYALAIERALPRATAEEIVRLHNTGATASTVAALAYVVGERITIDDFESLLNAGIDATFVEHLADHGYRNISAEKLVALKNSGFQP